jgi:hypothetical protein
MRVLAMPFLVAVLLIASGCASLGRGTESSEQAEFTAEDLAEFEDLTVLEAVEILRPHWLEPQPKEARGRSRGFGMKPPQTSHLGGILCRDVEKLWYWSTMSDHGARFTLKKGLVRSLDRPEDDT